MDDWFSVEKIDSNTYALSEYGHWEETHSYLFIGKNKAILFDTGLYEPSLGYLATGDLIYKGTIFCHYPGTDPQQLAKSIIKISELSGVARLLPAHHDLAISTSLLKEAKLLVEGISRKGLLKHGSGLHKSQNISIRF